ncbi:unnamed protein product [Rangifer tarandus platyrhynchus]|uniref:Uncharacterized protein n=1 Tax=Rangifer tarandus platyrhynchus TaxID=3082113 RepID=A0ABN8Y2Y7_RANTA|nr:unnamed protein product [Rangifer tarandus platyrhynchus]
MAETPTHSIPSCWPALYLERSNMSIHRSLLLTPVREWDALSAAGLTPGDWVGPPAPRAGLGLSVDRGRAAREARVRLRPGRVCARSGASGLAAGSSASPELEPAAVGTSSPSRSPLSGVQRGPPPRGPLSAALPVGLAVGLGQGLSPGLTATGSPSPTWRLRHEKEVRLPLHAASSGIWNQQEIAGAPSPRLCSQPSLW